MASHTLWVRWKSNLANDRRGISLRWLMIAMILCVLTGCGYHTSKSSQPVEQTIQSSRVNQLEQPNQTRFMRTPFQSYKKDVTVLLLGIDTRGESASRSDTIMLARFQPQNQKLKLVSLMRDSYVQIPGHGMSKLNHAYFYGGKELMKQTIEKNFRITIDHVALLDFEGFTHIVDQLAPSGVSVQVTEDMLGVIPVANHIGQQNLNGPQLLEYVRFRHDASSDFGRVKRQQEVLLAVKNEALDHFSSLEGISKLPDIISEVANEVETDLSTADFMSLGATLVLNPVQTVETMRIPVEQSFSSQTIKGRGSILAINIEKNTTALHQFLERAPT